MAIRKIVSRSIGTDVIVAEDIANNAITVAELANGAVTNAKIATGAISTDKLDSTAIRSGMKNRIINGAMVIDQRNGGASVTPSTGSSYTLDRWKNYNSQASKLSFQQNAGSVTPPAGFTNYLGATSLSAFSVGSTDEFDLYQLIEGFNVSDLGWGTANAKTVTLSFWVRSSLTGTFGGTVANTGNTRNYPFGYTISSANTWEQKSITITGDTTGTWLTTNGLGISLLFSLGGGSSLLGTAGAWTGSATVGVTGQTNLVSTSGATFYITGVQLEVGSSATGFEYRQYGQELALCQRYYQNQSNAGVTNDNAISNVFGGKQVNYYFPVNMRTNPTVTALNPSASISGSYGMVFQCRFESGSNFYTQGYTASAEL